MKKVFLFASVAALALGSCTSELDGPNMPNQGNYTSKIIATFNIGDNTDSRTQMEPNAAGTGYTYAWQQSDAIGLFNAVEGNDNTNAVFSYNKLTSTGDAEFVGQIEMLKEADYYGYYPYAQDTELENGSIEVNIPSSQNYNFAAAKAETGNLPSGSFTQNMAPAVAYGVATDDNIGTFKFYAVGSYLLFPVKGYTPAKFVEQVSLKIYEGDATEDATNITSTATKIAGPVSINMAEFDKVKDQSPYTLGTSGTTYTANYNADEIVLNCGSGVTISDDITWFWFVVPAELALNDVTVALQINESTPLLRYYNNESTTNTGRNKVLRVFADESQNPFIYYPEGTAYIQTEAQFLEYVNIITNGIDQDLKKLYNNMKDNNPGQAAWSIYPQIVNEAGTGVNPAVIVNPLIFSKQKIADLIGAGGDGNTIIGSSASLDPYFTYLQDFVDNDGALTQSIGGGASFIMSGAQIGGTTEAPVYASLSGLTIKANGMFTGNSTYTSSVSNLILSNITVDATGLTGPYAFLTPNPTGSNAIKGFVTVQNDCQLLPATDSKGALFNIVTVNAFSSANAINENENMLYANNLNVNGNKGFDFTAIEGASVNDFGKILVTQGGVGSVLYVADKTEAEDLLEVVWNDGATAAACTEFATSGNAFSVVQKATETAAAISFWTGTKYSAAPADLLTAENLAWWIQGNPTGKTINLLNDIDLMGRSWWNNSKTQAKETAFTINGGGKTISNVNIDGTTDGKTPQTSPYLTLFGGFAQVNELTVNNISISNVGEIENPYVAVLCASRTGACADVTVKGNVTVETETAAAYNTVGGLFSALYSTEGLEDLSISGIENTLPESIKAGYLAGYYNMTVSAPTANFINPVVDFEGEGNPFGKAIITVVAQDKVTPVITVEGFTLDYLKENVSIVLSAKATQLYTVNVVVDGNTYILQVEKDKTEFSGWALKN